MQTKIIIFSFTILFFLSFTQCKVKSQMQKTLCSQQMKKVMVGFYKANITKYNFLSLPEDFERENCYFLEVRDRSVNKTVMFMDVIHTSPEDKDQFILSMYDPSRGWNFETNTELEIMNGSFNSVYLEEQKKNEQYPERVVNFFQNLMLPLIESVEPSNYQEIEPFLRLCKMLQLEELTHAVLINIADTVVTEYLPFYLKNYPEIFLYSFMNLAPQMQNILIEKFEPFIMDISIQNELEYLTQYQSDTLYSYFKKIIQNLEILSVKSGKFGVSKLAKETNKVLNKISGQKILSFLTEYHKRVDKSKPKDWIHPSAEQEIETNPVKENMIAELNQIKDFEFQFYMVELFSIMGTKILQSHDKRAGMMEMVFSSSDKCLLSDFELDEMVNVAIAHKWLLPTTIKTNTRSLLRSCIKLVDGDQETFIFKLNPTGKSRCEIVIQRIDEDNEDGHSLNRTLEILPDTNPNYTYGNSCLRDTNRQTFENVHHPGMYYRRLL